MDKQETPTTSRPRLAWIDMMRGICMVLILYFHTEYYYAEANIIPYSMYVCDALIAFFLVSGYLFNGGNVCERGERREERGERIPQESTQGREPNVQRSTFNVQRNLIPYLFFTALISFPKALAHGSDFSISDAFFTIITGRASWFVAALIVAELVFSLIMWISRGKKWLRCALMLIIVPAIYVALRINSTLYTRQTHEVFIYFWQLDVAFLAVVFLYLGWLYRRYEHVFHRFHTSSSLLILSILFIIIKIYVYKSQIFLTIFPIQISNYVVFIADTLLFSFLLSAACKRTCRHHESTTFCLGLRWIGRRSIVFYFLCGGVPLLISMLLRRIGLPYNGCYPTIFLVLIIVIALASLITWFIYRYIPQVTGRKIR